MKSTDAFVYGKISTRIFQRHVFVVYATVFVVYGENRLRNLSQGVCCLTCYHYVTKCNERLD